MASIIRQINRGLPSRWCATHTVLAASALVLALALGPVLKLELVVNGLFLGSIVALGATGMTLIYGILRFPHVAHGDFMTSGAFISFFLLGTVFPKIGMVSTGLGPFTFGYPLLFAIPITAAAMVCLAVLLDVVVYRRLRRRGVGVMVLAMASLGVAAALRGLVQLIWSDGAEQLPRLAKPLYQLPLGVRIPPDSIFIGALSLSLLLALYLFLTRSKIGRAIKAAALPSATPGAGAARPRGLNDIKAQHVVRWTWVVSASMAATAGVLLAVYQGELFPIMGWRFLLPLFGAVILGGIGNPYGAFVGALCIGVASEVSTGWIDPSYRPAVAFAIILAALLLRPRGIFGARAVRD